METFETIQLETLPALTSPMMIVGLRGWGNALDVASEMAAHVVDRLEGRSIGRLDSDACYRYDENRPIVAIESGRMTSIHPPGGHLYSVETPPGENDLLVVIADEPSLNWYRFSRELVDVACGIEARGMISLGSMFDHVLHTDRIISAATTGDAFAGALRRHDVVPINYRGPSAIHTVLLEACRKRGLPGASLWCHCPAYLQGIVHHGLMIDLGRLLGELASFSLDTRTLESRWQALTIQIQELIAENPKLEGVMDQIRKKKRQGAWQHLENTGAATDNVINLKDFIDS